MGKGIARNTSSLRCSQLRRATRSSPNRDFRLAIRLLWQTQIAIRKRNAEAATIRSTRVEDCMTARSTVTIVQIAKGRDEWTVLDTTDWASRGEARVLTRPDPGRKRSPDLLGLRDSIAAIRPSCPPHCCDLRHKSGSAATTIV